VASIQTYTGVQSSILLAAQNQFMTLLLEFYVPKIRASRQLIWLRTSNIEKKLTKEESGAHNKMVTEHETGLRRGTVVPSYTELNSDRL
jgi:hypothetical protein